MKLFLSLRAKEDLLEIWEYIAEHDELAADRYTDQLQERACELLLFPELGRMREEIYSGVRSLLSRNHLIFYRIQGGEVQILRIIYGSMDLPKQEYPRIEPLY